MPKPRTSSVSCTATAGGSPQDYAHTLEWFCKAAEQGYAKAQNILGVMYRDGWGVPQDYVQARMWLNLAASRFPPGTDRDHAVRNRDFVAKHMTRAQIAEAQRMAREWTAKHNLYQLLVR